MTMMNRRHLMTRMAGISIAAGAPAALAETPVRFAPAESRFDYERHFSAASRVEHHLGMAMLAMNQLVCEEDSRWWISAMGSARPIDGHDQLAIKLYRWDVVPCEEYDGMKEIMSELKIGACS